jgi:predicted RNA-binding protein
MTPEGYAAIAGATVLVLGSIFKFALDWKKSRDEREAASERLQVLRDIAATNMRLVEGQIAQNGKLAQVVRINDDHHTELIRAIAQTCPARFNVPLEQKQKHEN